MENQERGIIKIKPVYIGIHHYRDVYGSVCSDDVEGTPPIEAPSEEELREKTQVITEEFRKKTDTLGFVEIEKPFIIKEHEDFRKLPALVTCDTDAFLVGNLGNVYLEMRTLSQYNVPIIRGDAGEAYLRALRVHKYIKQSKFLYIGEIPSFSAPNGPYDFDELEERLGVRVRHIETNEFYRWFDRFSDEDVKEELDIWRKDFDEVVEPDEHALMDAARVYMALRYLCRREDANGLTVNCGRFTEERPVVPCLAFNRLIDEGIICGCEGDITAMLSSLIIHAVSGQPMLMGNFGSHEGAFEAGKGEVTIEHDIIPVSMARTGFRIRDYHGRGFGVTGYAEIKREAMTLLNVDPSLEAMSVVQGRIKSSEDGIHCRIIIRMSVDGDIHQVPSVIMGSRHVSMTFGTWLDSLKKYGEIAGMEVRCL